MTWLRPTCSRRGLLLAGATWASGFGGVAQAAATAPWVAWGAFKRDFLSPDGRVISDDGRGSGTYSEGQAYGLFFALVGNDRPAFDLILEWTQNNLCAGDMHKRLAAWLWDQRADGTWGTVDENSASDADLWIVYALLEAARLWGSARYRELGEVQAQLLLDLECTWLPGLGWTMLPGQRGFDLGGGRWRLNASYYPLQVLDRCASELPDARWQSLRRSAWRVIAGSAPEGLVADWVVYTGDKGFAAPRGGDYSIGSYAAIRVYLWAGMLNVGSPWRARSLQLLRHMADIVVEQGEPPLRVDAWTGTAAGVGPQGFRAALLPFLTAQDEWQAAHAQELYLREHPVRQHAYYENCLALFGLGWMQQFYRFGPEGELEVAWRGA